MTEAEEAEYSGGGVGGGGGACGGACGGELVGGWGGTHLAALQRLEPARQQVVETVELLQRGAIPQRAEPAWLGLGLRLGLGLAFGFGFRVGL